ncbi:MAG TPA: class I SAM-dependent methyltransferase [Patescibacteria group bacterium]|nr:class I SAM-dependent methyltransferase [Patescibacteria group bacterium]
MLANTNPERKRIIVEIGCGSSPFATRVAPGRRALGPNDRYVGVDNFGDDPKKLDRAQELASTYELANRLEAQRTIQYGNADALPFGDREVDEVITVNFFGDHRTQRIHDDVAHEIARVLRQDGQLAVVETLTPDRIELPRLRSILGRYGLKQINEGSEHLPDGIAQYADAPQSSDYGAYHAQFAFRDKQPPKQIAPDATTPTPPTGSSSTEGGPSSIEQVCSQIMGSVATALQGLEFAQAAHQHLLEAQQTLDTGTAGSGSENIAGAIGGLGTATTHLKSSFDAITTMQTLCTEYITGTGYQIP